MRGLVGVFGEKATCAKRGDHELCHASQEVCVRVCARACVVTICVETAQADEAV